MRDKIAGFTLVTDSALNTGLAKERSTGQGATLLQVTNNCAASCRSRDWCKAFEPLFGMCSMVDQIDTSPVPSYVCYYWFRRN
jgi:hypothetical protein